MSTKCNDRKNANPVSNQKTNLAKFGKRFVFWNYMRFKTLLSNHYNADTYAADLIEAS